MRKIFIILLFSIPIFCLSQQWVKNYDINYEAKWIIEDYDKGYLILGVNILSYSYGIIIKTDINGNVLWKIHLGNGQYEFNPQNAEKTQDNGLIVCGIITKYGNQDAFVIKLNSCGELEWCSDIFTPTLPNDGAVRVKPTNDNGYILIGLYNDPDSKLRTNLFKLDSIGHLIWHKAYLPDSAAFFDDAVDVLIDSTGYFITASCFYPNPGGTGGYERFYFIKTDFSGNRLWSSIYGVQTYYYGYPYNNSLVSNTGNYYSFGKHDVMTSGVEHPALVKIFQNGIQSYNQDILSNVSQGAASSGIWLNDTNLIISCCYSLGSYVGNKIVKIDTLGNISDTFNIPNITTACILKMATTFDKKCIMAATNCPTSSCHIVAYKINSDLKWDSIYTHQYTYDSLCPHPIVSDTIDPTCQLVVNVEEPLTSPETHQMKIFPNPTTGKLIIILPKYLLVNDNTPPVKSSTIYHQWKSTTLYVYDLNGNQVFQKEIPKDQTQLELDVSAWAKGMYFFKLSYNKTEVDGKKVIVE